MISMDKKYKTRDGLEVEIYRTDAGSQLPIIGAYKTEYGNWSVYQWGVNGQAYPLHGHHLDLIEVKEPERKEYWINEYSSSCHSIFSKRLDAMGYRRDCTGTIGIELLIHDDGRKEARIIEVV